MFRRVHQRLALLNALVIVIVLALLGSLVYAHMRYRLYHDTDEILALAKQRLQQEANLPDLLRTSRPDPEQDERTTYLFWNAGGELVGQFPPQSFPVERTMPFKGDAGAPEPRTATAGGRSYRVLEFSYRASSDEPALSVGIVRSLEDATRTLHSLLRDIVLALLAGAAISVVAGLFLAGRALVPIRGAWEKQQRFVADASHELRTPIAIIHAQTEMLLSRPDHSIERESPGIAVILKESKRVGKLVEDLLTLARSDSNAAELQSAAIALDVLLRDVERQFQLLAALKDIEIRADIEDSLTLWGDEGRIRQLLVVLMDNALKYTPSGGRIGLTGRGHPHSVHIAVSDNGVGIGEAELPYLFDRFYRGDKTRSRADEGTGLGLSIAKWIVEAHGGSIRVHSKPNEGTRVEAGFPRKKRG